MNTVGIRTTPKKIFFAIINSESGQIVPMDLILPVSFDVPQQLKYVRNTLLDIFRQYNIRRAGIRVTEHSAGRCPDEMRASIEGVIQELIANSDVESYFIGVRSSIAARIGISNDQALTDVITGATSFREMQNWSNFSQEHREAILVAYSTLN
jgi:hypothetical protein